MQGLGILLLVVDLFDGKIFTFFLMRFVVRLLTVAATVTSLIATGTPLLVDGVEIHIVGAMGVAAFGGSGHVFVVLLFVLSERLWKVAMTAAK